MQKIIWVRINRWMDVTVDVVDGPKFVVGPAKISEATWWIAKTYNVKVFDVFRQVKNLIDGKMTEAKVVVNE